MTEQQLKKAKTFCEIQHEYLLIKNSLTKSDIVDLQQDIKTTIDNWRAKFTSPTQHKRLELFGYKKTLRLLLSAKIKWCNDKP